MSEKHLSLVPNEPEPGEMEPSAEITGQEILDKLQDHLEEEDIDFLRDSIDDPENPWETEDIIAYVYGRLLELGHDADLLFLQLGITEE